MAFATAEDVATRLGRDLSAAEEALAEYVIDSVTGEIVDAVDQDADWATALTPVPSVFKTLCVEKVVVVGTNPNGLASESKTLGQASQSRTYQRSNDDGIFLTDSEKRKVREAYYGTLSGTSRTRSALDDVFDYADDGEINDSVAD